MVLLRIDGEKQTLSSNISAELYQSHPNLIYSRYWLSKLPMIETIIYILIGLLQARIAVQPRTKPYEDEALDVN